MKSKIDLTIIKDILLEQWNEGDLSFDEALIVYESSTGRILDGESKVLFLKLLVNWNDFGIQKFVEIEKSNLEDNGAERLRGEKYIEQFVQQHFQKL